MYTVLITIPENQSEAAKIKETVQEMPLIPHEADLHVLSVHDETEIEEKSWTGKKVDKFPDILADPASELKESQFEVTLHRRFGNPVEKIERTVSEVDANLIVIGGRKRSPVGKALFGSTAQSIILRTNIPVLIASDH